jgi:hypothetical protein
MRQIKTFAVYSDADVAGANRWMAERQAEGASIVSAQLAPSRLAPKMSHFSAMGEVYTDIGSLTLLILYDDGAEDKGEKGGKKE